MIFPEKYKKYDYKVGHRNVSENNDRALNTAFYIAFFFVSLFFLLVK